MPHTIPDTTLSPAAEPKPVRYTSVFFPFAALPTFAANTTQAAKENGLTVNKSILPQKRPPQKVAYRGKNWPNRVKKEFDTEGADPENGVEGIQAYHFGARMYDPLVGLWLVVDPAEEFYNSYSYTGADPINLIDPNGELTYYYVESYENDDKAEYTFKEKQYFDPKKEGEGLTDFIVYDQNGKIIYHGDESEIQNWEYDGGDLNLLDNQSSVAIMARGMTYDAEGWDHGRDEKIRQNYDNACIPRAVFGMTGKKTTWEQATDYLAERGEVTRSDVSKGESKEESYVFANTLEGDLKSLKNWRPYHNNAVNAVHGGAITTTDRGAELVDWGGRWRVYKDAQRQTQYLERRGYGYHYYRLPRPKK